MKIEYGINVVDNDGNQLGTVDNIIRDSWSGDVKKFVVKRRELGSDLFLSPDDISVVDEDKIRLKLKSAELNQQGR